MNKISAVIITFNEEKNIRRCLESLQGVVDEIIIVDSFSTDRTSDICREYNVRYYERNFDGYSNQKNYANQKAIYPYILSLDADEALSEQLRSSILEVRKDTCFDAYAFNRLTNYCGKWIRHCGWYPDRKIRLWNKDKARWNEAYIHEDILLDENSTIGQLSGDLLHYSYYSISDHVLQANKFTEMTAFDANRRGKKAGIGSIIFRPFWKFIRDYFFRLGFLDGYYGLVICIISAHATFLKYIKLKEYNKTKDGK